jgi:phage tail sheath gpL-like
VEFTAKNKGTMGNEIDLRLNYYEDELLPAGVAAVITPMADGATNPSLTNAITAMADTQFHVIGFPYTDSSSLGDLEDELSDRWGPIRQIEGLAFVGSNQDQGDNLTLGDSRNSPHVSIIDTYNYPTMPYEVAAAAAGVAAFYGAVDPARPFQTLQLKEILPPTVTQRKVYSESNLLLFDGISTLYVDGGGKVRIQRLITTYQENAASAPDPSYLSVETMLTLSYLRFDFRTTLQLKYPRHKLADDGTRYGAGQAVITPKVGKAEAIAKFRQWEELGLVEGADQFKRDLIVERNATDPNRLDFYLPPDLINQLVSTAVKIAFLL